MQVRYCYSDFDTKYYSVVRAHAVKSKCSCALRTTLHSKGSSCERSGQISSQAQATALHAGRKTSKSSVADSESVAAMLDAMERSLGLDEGTYETEVQQVHPQWSGDSMEPRCSSNELSNELLRISCLLQCGLGQKKGFDFALGKTKVFLRECAETLLLVSREKVLGNAASRIQSKISAYVARERWRTCRDAAQRILDRISACVARRKFEGCLVGAVLLHAWIRSACIRRRRCAIQVIGAYACAQAKRQLHMKLDPACRVLQARMRGYLQRHARVRACAGSQVEQSSHYCDEKIVESRSHKLSLQNLMQTERVSPVWMGKRDPNLFGETSDLSEGFVASPECVGESRARNRWERSPDGMGECQSAASLDVEEGTALRTPRSWMRSLSERDASNFGAVTITHTHIATPAQPVIRTTPPHPSPTHVRKLKRAHSLLNVPLAHTPPTCTHRSAHGHISQSPPVRAHTLTRGQSETHLAHTPPVHTHLVSPALQDSTSDSQAHSALPSHAHPYGYSAVMTPRTAVRTIDGYLLSPKDHLEAERNNRKQNFHQVLHFSYFPCTSTRPECANLDHSDYTAIESTSFELVPLLFEILSIFELVLTRFGPPNFSEICALLPS